MKAANGHDEPCAGAAETAVRPMILVRYRPGVTGQSARIVHMIPLPTDRQVGAVSAICGALLRLHNIETVIPGQGMPCRLCVVNHVTSSAPTGKLPTANPEGADTAMLAVGGIAFQEWGWPVTCHRDQIQLSLHHEVSALTIPIPLCTKVTEILIRRRCAPPVLAHPYTPDHRIVLAGERYDVTLPWPHQVHRVTGVLLLPPTVTPRGPITWIESPQKDSLRLCRDIDLFGALRTALNDSPSGDPPPSGTTLRRKPDGMAG